MSDKPHKDVQSPSEMLEAAKERRLNNRIYSKTSDSGLVVQSIVDDLACRIATMPEKADLKNTEQIRQICIAYTAMSSQAGVIPSKAGLALALGMTTRNMDLFVSTNPGHPTTRLLEIVFEAYSDALTTAAMAGSVREIYSIFIQKAIWGLRDNTTIEISNLKEDPLGERESSDKIAAKYKDLIESGMLPD